MFIQCVYQGTHLSPWQEVVNYVKQNENLAFVQTYILTLPEDESFSYRAAQNYLYTCNNGKK